MGEFFQRIRIHPGKFQWTMQETKHTNLPSDVCCQLQPPDIAMTVIIGESTNFAAYAYAPATLVAPLGSFRVIFSSVLSSIFLKEKLNFTGKVGCAFCVIGSTVMIIHSPHELEVASIDELKEKIQETGLIRYALLMVGTALTVMIFLAPKYGNRTALVYITICSTLGSFTVMGCKGVGVAYQQTIHGHNQLKK